MASPMSNLQTALMCFISSAALLFLAVAPITAANKGKGESAYHDLRKRVESGDMSVDFRALRFACLEAEDCDARGESEDVVSLRRAMQARKFGQAAKAAEKLIQQGFVNIEAHALCADAYASLKDEERAKFHHDVAMALLRSIANSGDGKTKESAFEVIGTQEEYFMVRVMGFSPLPVSQAVIPGKPHSYDVLKVRRPGADEEVSVYFKIDAFFPMKGL